jgi:hypothetical protein
MFPNMQAFFSSLGIKGKHTEAGFIQGVEKEEIKETW